VENVTSGRQRVWLILHNEKFNPKDETIIESTLAERFRLVDEHVFSGDAVPVTVELYGATHRPVTQCK
jgi:hypothetical protein